MLWIAPSEKGTNTAALEKRLWDAAEQAGPAPHFAEPGFNGGRPQGLLGLIFLRFAEVRFAAQRAKLDKASSSSRRGSRVDEPAAYLAEGILYLPAEARFVSEHKKNPAAELSIHGVEKTDATGRLCRLNLAVNGLEGEIKHGSNINSYYDDPHDATGRFDIVLANPPSNVNAVDTDTAMRVSARRQPEGTPQDLPERRDHERLKDSVGFDANGAPRRFPFDLPRTDNANYLWIQLFYSALKSGEAATSGGRAGSSCDRRVCCRWKWDLKLNKHGPRAARSNARCPRTMTPRALKASDAAIT